MKLFSIIILIYSLAQASEVQWCKKDIYETKFHFGQEDLEVLAIWSPVRAGYRNVLQLCSEHTGQRMVRQCSYNSNDTNAKWDYIDKRTMLFDCDIMGQGCVEELFIHNYVLTNNVKESFNNSWQFGQVGEQVCLKTPCLFANGSVLTRKCVYEPKLYMALWEPIRDNAKFKDVDCLSHIEEDVVTYDLNKMVLELKTNGSALKDSDRLAKATELLELLVKNNTQRISADLELTTKILKVITQSKNEPDMLKKIVEITDNLLKSDGDSVDTSSESNSPHQLIQTVEKYYDGMSNMMVPTSQCQYIDNGVKYEMAVKTSIFMINPYCSNFSGIAIYSPEVSRSDYPPSSLFYDVHTNSILRFLTLNQSLEELLAEPHLQVASYFPQALWDKLLTESEGISNIETLRFTIYNNGYFFVDQGTNGNMPEGIVLTASIPDYRGDLPDDLAFILRHKQINDQDTPKCGYWDYNKWNSMGVATTIQPNDNLILCRTRHLTPYALFGGAMVKPPKIHTVLTALVGPAMDIISITGCGLSLFIILCILMTAIFIKKWRSETMSKALLNICFVVTFITVYFVFINMTEIRDLFVDMENRLHCIGMGSFLHYSILVLFSWMFVVTLLLYQRYVKVIGVNRPSRSVFIYALAAWGLPLIPTLAIAYFDPNAYKPPPQNSDNDYSAIYYPLGNSLYYGVMLPIGVIIVANAIIFLYIVCSIHPSLKKFNKISESKDLKQKLRLSILLFFLLGISWVFGVMAYLNGKRLYSFLFCLTSTLQGFVLFINVMFCPTKKYCMIDEPDMMPLKDINNSEKQGNQENTKHIIIVKDLF